MKRKFKLEDGIVIYPKILHSQEMRPLTQFEQEVLNETYKKSLKKNPTRPRK